MLVIIVEFALWLAWVFLLFKSQYNAAIFVLGKRNLLSAYNLDKLFAFIYIYDVI